MVGIDLGIGQYHTRYPLSVDLVRHGGEGPAKGNGRVEEGLADFTFLDIHPTEFDLHPLNWHDYWPPVALTAKESAACCSLVSTSNPKGAIATGTTASLVDSTVCSLASRREILLSFCFTL